MEQSIAPFLPLITLIVIVFGLFPFLMRRKAKRYAECAQILFPGSMHRIVSNFVVMGITLSKKLEVEIDGRKFFLTDHDGSKNSPAHTDLRIECRIPIDLRLTKQGTLSNFGKSLGVLQDVEVGEAGFDEKFIVKSSDPTAAQMLLMKQDLRELCLALLEAGNFSYLNFERAKNPSESSTIHLQRYRNAKFIISEPESAKLIVQQLLELAALVEQ